MPPCRNVLLKKIKRSHHLTTMIKNARNNSINLELENEWCVDENNKLLIKYFDGNSYPDSITDITITDENESEEEEISYISESDDDEYYDYDSDE